jgi:hypothetical protein
VRNHLALTRGRDEEGYDGMVMQYSCRSDHAKEKEPEIPKLQEEGLDKLIRVCGYVFAAVYIWRKKEGAQGPVLINPIEAGKRKVGYSSVKCQHVGEMYLLALAQKGMKVVGEKMLAVDVLTEEDVLGRRRKLITVGSRVANQVENEYRRKALPLLQSVHPLARLYMKKAHEKEHEGAISTLPRPRKEVWIIGERALAESVRTG